MPMGGLGSRFVDAGYDTPKALIPVDGKPMFMRSLDSYGDVEDANHIFVIRREHEDTYQLSDQIHEQLPDAKIVVMDHNTRGAAETALLASDYIDDTLPIIVADCDIYFESRDYFQKVVNVIETGQPDGVLLTFNSQDPRYGYVETDGTSNAIRTAEKNVISNHAILGGYFFVSGQTFKETAQEFLANELPEGLKEYFISHLFNVLMEAGKRVEIAELDNMYIFGTPDELNAYFKEHPQNV